VIAADPITAGWMRHLREHPVGPGETVLLNRRWLDIEHGELPCATQAACWLDIKGVYVEMRATLRRIYLTVADLEAYAEVAASLGFEVIEHGSVVLDGKRYHSAFLDFGPAHVNGWLARHLRRELGLAEEPLLDHDTREALVGGARCPLSPLEFGVLALLEERRGKPVSRADFAELVWGYSDNGGSNVVDVVVGSLRKKLGPRASLIETVRGAGYRLRSE
jgi:DNA-binding response OmpR family regulator